MYFLQDYSRISNVLREKAPSGHRLLLPHHQSHSSIRLLIWMFAQIAWVALVGSGRLSAQTVSPALRAITAVAPVEHRICPGAGAGDCAVRIYTLTQQGYSVTLVVVQLPATGVRFRARGGFDSLGSANGLYEAATEPGDLVVMSGGYQRSNQRTGRRERVGLLISNRCLLSRYAAWRAGNKLVGGVVLDRGRGPEIVPAEVFAQTTDIVDAVQTMPILVENGRNARVRDTRQANRVAIARRFDGSFVVAGIFGSPEQAPVSAKDWADFVAAPVADGGLGAEIALQLESGPPGHIYLPTLRLHFGRNVTGWLPSTVHLQREARR